MAAPSISGSEFTDFWNGASYTSAGIVWGTTVADLVLVVGISLTANNNVAPSVTSVSDSLGLTWHKLGSSSQLGITSGITSGPIAQELEIWYAISAGNPSWTGHTITVAASANTDVGIIDATRLKGCLLADPVDHNVSLPAHTERTTASTAATLTLSGVSTTTANVCVFAVRGAAGAGNNINSGSFTIAGVSGDFGAGTLHNNTNYNIMSTAGKGFTAAQSGISIVSNTSIDNSMLLAAAFTADVQGAPAPTIGSAMIIG